MMGDFKKLYSFFVFPIFLILSGCASTHEKAHNECIGAKNYYKCLSNKNISNSGFNIRKTSSYRKEFSSCVRSIKKLLKKNYSLSNEAIKVGCSYIAEEYVANPNHIADKVENINVNLQGNKSENLSNVYKLCMIADYSTAFKKDNLDFNQIKNDIKFFCSCEISSYSKMPKRRVNEKIFVGHRTKDDLITQSCWWRRPSQTSQHNGILYYVKNNNRFSSDYGIKINSLKQAKIRKRHGRYLSFMGKTTNKYSGTSSYTIPGTPGYLNCNWGSSGNLYGNSSSFYGGYSSGGNCYGREGTDPIYVPGKAAGVQKNFFKYLLDCEDKTFDRKGDIKTAGQIYRKGWMNIAEDRTALYAHGVFCPILPTLTKEY